MVTALVAGAAVPLWDRKLMHGLSASVVGLTPEDSPQWAISVLNDEGQRYRRVVAEGSKECLAVLECFAEQGFHLTRFDDLPAMSRVPRQLDLE